MRDLSVTERPTLRTRRLLLRPFTLADAPEVRRLASDRAIASTTWRVPHPYPEGAAEAWIATHEERFTSGAGADFAVVALDDDRLVGSMGLEISGDHRWAELGYWVAVAEWGHGYATEAARAVLDYAFRELDLNRVHAHHMTRNPASGRVLEKVGMRHEGELRQHVRKWGRFEDVRWLGILRSEWEGSA
jgi:RimJ/RimL family protein N-acetyltransferase